tara:strand:- start:14 stop:370 length:357 start_codon:yes stop_codon:yes gene_type:complete
MAKDFPLQIFQGEAFSIPWTVEKNGAAHDVSALDTDKLRYRVGRLGNETMISKDRDAGITFNTDGTDGQILIALANADTAPLVAGTYFHQLTIKPEAGVERVVFYGVFRVKDSLTEAG